MSKVKKGIYRIAFPFAEGEGFKRRPALALTEPDAFGDVVWAFISTKKRHSARALRIDSGTLAEGALPQECYLHMEKTFTIHSDRIVSRYATVSDCFWGEIQRALVLSCTKEFSESMHAHNRPGNDPLHPHNASTGSSGITVPYAGRVFDADEVEAAVSSTLDFWLTLGKEGDGLSEELSRFLGVKHTVLTNSGSSANLLAVSALTSHKLPKHKRLVPGDEVITCAAGFPTTVAPLLQNGLVPVFIDNDPVTGNARVDQLEAAFREGRTKAVMFAHTLGNPFDLGAVCAFCHKHDLWLIEDNCDALGCTYSLPVEEAEAIGLGHLLKLAQKGERASGAPRIENGILTAYTGSFGDLSTQSFYPPHHLTMGEGGAINIVRRAQLKTLVESFRDWGRDCWCASGVDNTCGKRFGWHLGDLPKGYDHKYIYSHIGYNLKPLDPQAAIGRQQVKKLPQFIEARKRNWAFLRSGLAGLESVFHFSLPTHATKWDRDGFSWDGTGHAVDCSWFGFMLLVKPEAPFSKSEFAQFLDKKKIGNRMLFGGNLLRQPAFVQLKKDRPDSFRVVRVMSSSGESTISPVESETSPSNSKLELETSLPGADRIMNEAVFIGVYPGLSKAQLDFMISEIRGFVSQKVIKKSKI